MNPSMKTKQIDAIRRRTWAEIDLDAAEENYRAVQSALTPSVGICAVIKANAYGHGAVRMAKLYESLGARFLAVSNIEEALQLRRGGIRSPILILGYTSEECAGILAAQGISQCVYSEAYGRKLAAAARSFGVSVKIHVKLDTGMGRIGFDCRGGREDGENGLYEALELCRAEGLIPEGVFTHFSDADSGDAGREYTERQIALFRNALSYFDAAGVRFEVRHASNSAAIFDYPEAGFDMVRAGIVLYGVLPSHRMKNPPILRSVMSLHSIVSHIKTLRQGESLSYGRSFTAEKPMRVATVPIGYADGLMRTVGEGKYFLSVNREKAPILGRICMDQLMIDVSAVECAEGDPVTVFGPSDFASVETLAAACDSIPYEILCAVGERVPRAFLRGGQIVEWNDGIFKGDLR